MTAANVPAGPALRLDQLLKVHRLVASGGQAKLLIQGGEVCVNGQVETCRGRQLRAGDVVTVNEVTIVYDGSRRD